MLGCGKVINFSRVTWQRFVHYSFAFHDDTHSLARAHTHSPEHRRYSHVVR